MSSFDSYVMTDSIHSLIWFFGKAPTLVPASSPPLNIIRVGIPLTPYFDGAAGLSSMLTLAMVSLSPNS